jgi:hypothetical protein
MFAAYNAKLDAAFAAQGAKLDNILAALLMNKAPSKAPGDNDDQQRSFGDFGANS